MDISFLTAGADSGNTAAQTILGALYLEGSGVPRDYSKARELLASAAAKGSARARLALARMLLNALGGPADHVKALELYGPAAEAGDPNAQIALGRVYAQGLGVSAQPQLARRWYEAALAQEDRLERSEEADEARAFLRKLTHPPFGPETWPY